MADDIEALKLKITELENKLNELATGPEPEDISAEEVAAYQKVVSQIPQITVCSRPCVSGCRGCGRGGCASPCVVMALDDEEIQGAAACRGACNVMPCVIRPCGGRGSCVVAAAAGEEEIQGAAACRGGCYVMNRCVLSGARGCSGGACTTCRVVAGDQEIQGAVACRGCGGCSCGYCYYANAVPCTGAAVGGSRPEGGVGRFARLGA